MVPPTEASRQGVRGKAFGARLSGFQSKGVPQAIRAAAAISSVDCSKGVSSAHSCLKTRRVRVRVAQQRAKRFDLLSYALIFVMIVFAAEMILAALVW
ncbi:MAG: hypothetical protein DME57_03245 [Verrucomicrobia bacterium]|nr:MAG: hypothetical protein DME57_03245 [Verrucomicrobiota bacterium]